ncbi:MAG TPA: trigger factor, partial [Rhizobiaceae bacterium]|nr:trigger factor [Rhizobiaceae bacterium]
ARLSEKLDDAKDKVRLKGFRPGKAPAALLRKMYGKSLMAEIVNDLLSNKPREILAERGEKSATQPEIAMTEDEKEAERILAGQADFEFSMSYEIVPVIEVGDLTGISVTRPVVDIPDEDVEKQAARVAESARDYSTKDGAAESGDRVTIDYAGSIDGEPFEGGADNGAKLVLGSGNFIPGFEDQLIGAKAGDERTVKVTFPEDYPAAHLAGKEASFAVTVQAVETAGELVIDDELAKKLGLESAERLRTIVREQMESQFGAMTRQKVKRQILDALDNDYKFDTPSKLVDAEFNNIWNQILKDLQEAGKTFEDEETTEDAARDEYRRLAERRVRLGLLLSEIGEKAGVTVTEDELQRSLYNHIRQYPGQEQQVYDFFRNNPDAVANLRAPIFEEKVIDHLLATIKVEDKTVTREELMADDEDELATAKKASAEDKDAEKPAKKKAAKKKAKDEEAAGTGE